MVNKLLVGKVDDNFNWLPLWVHLQETAGVMKLLLENWIADATVESCGMQLLMILEKPHHIFKQLYVKKYRFYMTILLVRV